MSDERVPNCRCKLPMLRIGNAHDSWACAECDQGQKDGRTVATAWFVRWQKERQAERQAQIENREG